MGEWSRRRYGFVAGHGRLAAEGIHDLGLRGSGNELHRVDRNPGIGKGLHLRGRSQRIHEPQSSLGSNGVRRLERPDADQ